MRTRRLSGMGWAIVIFLTVDAVADVATEARFFDAIARHAYRGGHYEQALEAFLLVQEVAPSPGGLYNIALSADLAGKGDVAFEQYREYLASDDTDPKRRREAERSARRLQRRLALVEIVSAPAGAAIYVDRKELGQYGVTPRTIAVASGERRIIVEAPGYRAEETPVTARTGASAHLGVSLTPRFGIVTINVTPASAGVEFWRDETRVAFTLEQGRYRLPIGPYTVSVSAPGHESTRARVVVEENGTARVDIGLSRLPSPTGRLLVSSGSMTADVFIDGRRTAVTPAVLPEIAAGEHALEVRSASRVSRRRIKIEAGHATYVEVDLNGRDP